MVRHRRGIGRGAALALVFCVVVGGAWVAAAQPGVASREGSCIGCHELEEEEELRLPVPEWRDSVHAQHEVSCDACHGGDPHEEDADLSMSEEAGFLDNPSWTEMASYCGVCHEAIAEHYEVGHFGQRMRAGELVPSCATCHMADGHRILVARPEELATSERCPECLEVAGLDASLRALERTADNERLARARIAQVEHKGIALAEFSADVGRIGEVYRASLHEFSPEVIEAASTLAVTQLQGTAERAQAFEHEADARRRFGVLLLLLLGLLFAGLWGVRRSLR